MLVGISRFFLTKTPNYGTQSKVVQPYTRKKTIISSIHKLMDQIKAVVFDKIEVEHREMCKMSAIMPFLTYQDIEPEVKSMNLVFFQTTCSENLSKKILMEK